MSVRKEPCHQQPRQPAGYLSRLAPAPAASQPRARPVFHVSKLSEVALERGERACPETAQQASVKKRLLFALLENRGGGGESERGNKNIMLTPLQVPSVGSEWGWAPGLSQKACARLWWIWSKDCREMFVIVFVCFYSYHFVI